MSPVPVVTFLPEVSLEKLIEVLSYANISGISGKLVNCLLYTSMLQAVGNEVVYLKRLSMGALVLDETLSKGSWRALTEEEKAQLGV